MNQVKNVLLAIAAVLAIWWLWLEIRPTISGGVIPLPVYVTPAPAQIIIQQVDILPAPIYVATNPPPVNVGEMVPVQPTAEFQRGGLIGEGVATGVVGVHDPGNGHHRTP